MLLLLITLLVGAGDVTLNGADIGALRSQTFKGVDVTIDADGNVHLTSDRYAVQVQRQAARPAPIKAAPAPVKVSRTGDWGQARPAMMTSSKANVPVGQWWLATEDKGSVGHEVRVYVNGSLAKTIRSGDAAVIDDIGRFLKAGDNDIMVQSRSMNPAGGALYIYLGEGDNSGGTVTLSKPQLQHALGPSRRGDEVREYVLRVP